jgi:hypothetical protein
MMNDAEPKDTAKRTTSPPGPFFCPWNRFGRYRVPGTPDRPNAPVSQFLTPAACLTRIFIVLPSCVWGNAQMPRSMLLPSRGEIGV